MGGTGIPDPTAFPNYVPNVTSYYIAPNTSCKMGSCQLVPAITPEQLFPFIGLMTYDQSVAAGVVDLDRIGPVRVVDGMITGWHDAGVLFGRALDFSKSELPSG